MTAKHKPDAPAPAPGSSPWATAAAAGRVLVGLAFIVAGFQKAVAPPEEFAAVLEAYYLLPDAWLLPLARSMPWAELLLGVFLAAGFQTRAAAAGLAAMLLSFLAALGSARYRGIPLDHCGCFGEAVKLTPAQALAVDTLLLALALLAFKRGRERLSLDNWIDAGSP